MPTVHPEFEAKYEVDEDAALPGLVELVQATQAAGPERSRAGSDGAPAGEGPWAEGDVAEHDLSATYLDTADLRLTAAGLTLRRRTGGTDAGWHLKVPMPDGSRSEIRLPLEAGTEGEVDGSGDGGGEGGGDGGGDGGTVTVPDVLRTMTHARTGGRELRPVARVDNHRTVRHLVDPTGRVLLELADDRVTARRLGGTAGDGAAGTTDGTPDGSPDGTGDGTPDGPWSWREVEVEVVDGPRGLLEALDPVLRERGLRPAASRSKLARTLAGGSSDAVPPAPATDRDRTRLGASSTAGDVVLAHVAAQVEQIRAQDLPVRLDVDGAVHAMRVATRRLRSALRTFRPLLRGSATRPLARELKWLAGVLGTARDAEVVRGRVVTAVGDQSDDGGWAAPSADVTDEVRGRLDDAYTTAHRALRAELESERYLALLDRLADLLEDPSLTKRARRPARRVLPDLVADGDAEVRSAMRAARRATDPAEQEALLHEGRKAAKRARYAAEAVAPALGDDARRFAAAMEAVQEAVGEHLDARNTRTRLRELAEQTTVPQTAFTLGRLHAIEDARAERSRADVDSAWAAARTKRLRRWLR